MMIFFEEKYCLSLNVLNAATYAITNMFNLDMHACITFGQCWFTYLPLENLNEILSCV